MEYKITKSSYELKITDHILDNIYGQIGLTEVEKKLERCSIFKRLHNLSQLGLVNWIFPCALHNRYTHSIGVMYIVSEMAERININMGKPFFNDSEIQILRLTGLLHDIGHYPLSHNIEFAYKDAQKKAKYEAEEVSKNLDHFVNCPDFLNPYLPKNEDDSLEKIKDQKLNAEEKFSKGFSGSSGFHHEQMGYLVVTNNKEIRDIIKNHFVLLEHNGEWSLNPFFCDDESKDVILEEEVETIVDALLSAIGNIIIGNYAFENDKHYKWLEKYSAMIQLIHSDLDADNLDYLLRDATFSGTSYGTMDMGILLNCLYVKKLQYKDEYKYIVGVTQKGLGAVEQFLIGKFMAYTQMILSKYVSILEAMIYRLEAENFIQDDKDYETEKLLTMVKERDTSVNYLRFADSYIFDKLHSSSTYKSVFKPLQRMIIDRLIHSCAFDLDDREDNQCICASTNVEDIVNEFKKNTLYKEFLETCKSLEGKLGKDLQNSDEDAKLFSYRFESYKLSKQIPINEFMDKFNYKDMEPNRRFNFHYYRLANGIPILNPHKDYLYSEDKEENLQLNEIPELCIDSPLSMLKDISDLRFVALRKYKICEYTS